MFSDSQQSSTLCSGFGKSGNIINYNSVVIPIKRAYFYFDIHSELIELMNSNCLELLYQLFYSVSTNRFISSEHIRPLRS